MSTIVHLPSTTARAVVSGGGAAAAGAPGAAVWARVKPREGCRLLQRGCKGGAAAAGVLRLPAAPGAPVRLQSAGWAEGAEAHGVSGTGRRSGARR